MAIKKHEKFNATKQECLDWANALTGVATNVKTALVASIDAVHILDTERMNVTAMVDTVLSGTSVWTDTLMIDVRSL